MLKTYTLYLRDGRDDRAAFEPIMCETPIELMRKTREILAQHPECCAIDVYFGDAELFRVEQDPKV